jgi:hypothetical protein
MFDAPFPTSSPSDPFAHPFQSVLSFGQFELEITAVHLNGRLLNARIPESSDSLDRTAALARLQQLCDAESLHPEGGLDEGFYLRISPQQVVGPDVDVRLELVAAEG